MERDFFEIDAALLRENASQALQQALSAHRAVTVPRLDFPMELDRPIVLDSGNALRGRRLSAIIPKVCEAASNMASMSALSSSGII